MEGSEALHPAIQALKTVCRCNNIKYRTIERVIREGCCTVAEVAQRTGATTGYCGGTCTPDIQQMIADQTGLRTAPACNAAVNAVSAEGWWVRKK